VRVSLLVPAAGRGERLGLGVPKALVRVRGRTLLEWALRRFPGVDEVLVALPPGIEAPSGLGARFLEGGRTRQESVHRLLQEATGELVLVHDAARPFVVPEAVERVLAAARRTGAAVPAIPVPDTLVEGEAAYGRVLDRARLRLVQTPQGFSRTLLLAAHRAARTEGRVATDDAQLVRALGRPVALVPGDRRMFKVTYPEDLALLAALLQAEADERA